MEPRAASPRTFFRGIFRPHKASKRQRLLLLWRYNLNTDPPCIPGLEDVGLAVYKEFSSVGRVQVSGSDGLAQRVQVPAYSPVNSLCCEQLFQLDSEFLGGAEWHLDSIGTDSIGTLPSMDLFQFDRLISADNMGQSTDVKRSKLVRRNMFQGDVNVARSASTLSTLSFVTLAVPTLRTASGEKENSTIRFEETTQLVVYKETRARQPAQPLVGRLAVFKQFGTFRLFEGGDGNQLVSIPPSRHKSILKSKLNGNKLVEVQLARREDTVSMNTFLHSLENSEHARWENLQSLTGMRRHQMAMYDRTQES